MSKKGAKLEDPRKLVKTLDIESTEEGEYYKAESKKED